VKADEASRTAERVALRRAAHQLLDHPRILDDPVAVWLVGEAAARREREDSELGRRLRASLAARSRYARPARSAPR
jgi:O-methyltransferase involved in polyketide biosynthesis